MSTYVFLRGEDVILRPIDINDVPFLTKWINDPDVRHFVSNFLPKSEIDEKKWVEKLGSSDSNIVFMIEVQGQPIGTMGIHGINWKDRRGTTGALIGEKDYWGKGYGSKAKLLLLEYAFNTLNLRKICSLALATNVRSIKYSLKCGYKEEGRLKEQHFVNGKYVDVVQLAIFAHEWRLRNQ